METGDSDVTALYRHTLRLSTVMTSLRNEAVSYPWKPVAVTFTFSLTKGIILVDILHQR